MMAAPRKPMALMGASSLPLAKTGHGKFRVRQILRPSDSRRGAPAKGAKSGIDVRKGSKADLTDRFQIAKRSPARRDPTGLLAPGGANAGLQNRASPKNTGWSNGVPSKRNGPRKGVPRGR